jgi:hypothetical protein
LYDAEWIFSTLPQLARLINVRDAKIQRKWRKQVKAIGNGMEQKTEKKSRRDETSSTARIHGRWIETKAGDDHKSNDRTLPNPPLSLTHSI